jgi:hypothetical protein
MYGHLDHRYLPQMIEGSEEVVVPNFDSKIREESNPSVGEVRLGMDMPSPSTPARKKRRWLTQTLQNVQEHVGKSKCGRGEIGDGYALTFYSSTQEAEMAYSNIAKCTRACRSSQIINGAENTS